MTPEEYAKMHKTAFRIAFDFLNTHFPPGDTDEWWVQSAKDFADASISGGENRLVMELLNAVCTYIGDEYQKRRNEHGKTED